MPEEKALNIYLIIENNRVIGLKAKSYLVDGSDEEKINFLKSKAREDFNGSYAFDPPLYKDQKPFKYSKFSKLEKLGMHCELYGEIFERFEVPDEPIICVTPCLNGKLLAD